MKNLNKKSLENVCLDCLSAFEGVLSWKWDSRFDAVLAEFCVSDKDNVKDILKRYLSVTWDNASISNAPDTIRMIANYLGGIMPGQLLFTTDSSDTLVFCAWWPWGDGNTISIRVAPFFYQPDNPEKAEMIHQLRGRFGI